MPPAHLITSAPRSRTTRKRLGAWYTPAALAEALTSWAVRRGSDRVLDPACGDGVFLAAARERKKRLGGRGGSSVVGCDVNPEAVAASLRESTNAAPSDVRLGDFFDCDSSQLGRFDAVVGNPPYVRFQLFTSSAPRASARAMDQGVKLSRLASSWAAFVVHASAFLKDEGRLAFVLPEELLQAGYAAPVRAFLRDRFADVVVVGAETGLFPESQERVLVLLAEGRRDAREAGVVRLARIADFGALEEVIACGFPEAEVVPTDVPEGRWRLSDGEQGLKILDALTEAGLFVRLDAVAKAGIGYVSGANDFFVVKPSTIAARAFPLSAFKPSVVSARQVTGARFGDDDLVALYSADAACLLWDGTKSDEASLRAYRSEGVRSGISGRYKCRVREPWFVVPGVRTPDAFLTYMSHVAPRLALNDAQATCSNTLLGVDLFGVPARHRTAFVGSFHSSATALSAEREGRRYGGGVLKLEPREADALRVPTPALLRRLSRPAALLSTVDALLRSGRPEAAAARVDSALLRDAAGLSAAECVAVRDAAARRRQSRLGGRKSISRPKQ